VADPDLELRGRGDGALACLLCFFFLPKISGAGPRGPSLGSATDFNSNNNRGVFHLQCISENFYWEFLFGKSAFQLSQVPFEGAEVGLAA